MVAKMQRRREHLLRVLQQEFARARERHTARTALKQRHAEFPLQGADVAADGRLREMQLFRGVRDVAFRGHCHKASQLGQIHAVGAGIPLRTGTIRIRSDRW